MKLLPSPKDLGHPSNALPSRVFGAADGAYTWEDHHEFCRQRYPWRWRVSKALMWMNHWPRLSQAWYWIRTHTYNRYHLLDLRRAEPENPDGYRWGWIDRDRMLLIASFKILRDFVEKEKPWPVADIIAKREVDGDPNGELPSLRRQQERFSEVMALYEWWIAGRFIERAAWQKASDALQLAWKQSGAQADADAWIAHVQTENAREDEMLARLLAVRHYLWT
jgi:hypothetical protein